MSVYFETQAPSQARQLRLERLYQELERLRLISLLPTEQRSFLKEHPSLFGLSSSSVSAGEPGMPEGEAAALGAQMERLPSATLRTECLQWMETSLNHLLQTAPGDRRHRLIQYLS